MEADFDPEDKYSWYFGMLSRERTNDILLGQQHSGVFLVRESKTQRGDFVLCVKEDSKVSHYIINRVQAPDNMSRFKIGDKEFPDIPSLLNFYKTHYLDTTTLIRPAPRAKLLCKFDFHGKDPEDLAFRRGDILEVISEDEEEWWTARNLNGDVGQIPVKYTEPIVSSQLPNPGPQRPQETYMAPQPIQPIHEDYRAVDRTGAIPSIPAHPSIQLPAKAIVILQRVPSAYDKRQLKLELNDIVTVHKMNLNGQWEGSIKEKNGNIKEGIFPFTHIRFLTPEELRNLPT